MTTIRFFAIGSWTEGMFHFKKLKPFIASCEVAYVKAQAYRLPVGFPVLLDAGVAVGENNSHESDRICGQLIELRYDETLLALMDSLHGVNLQNPEKGLHIRQSVEVVKSSGETESVQVYFFNPKKLSAKSQRIAGGVWQESLQQAPPLPEQLTEKQRTYVLRLGAVKGRDIVPINDLSLYRELMKLDLIVDKGRRLALSHLGKEVYSYLV
jgi:hypothetical protein